MGQALLAPSRQLIVGPRGFRKPARPVLDSSAPINRGLAVCWPLGDVAGTGATAGELTNNLIGKTVGSVTLGASHHGGQATSFARASDQYITATVPRLVSPKQISVSLWAYYSGNFGSDAYLVSNRTGGNQGWSFYIAPANASVATLTFVFQGVAAYPCTVANSVGHDAWVHLAISWDGANVRFYQNGVQQGTAVATGSLAAGSNTLVIGDAGPPGTNVSWNGRIEGVRCFDRLISLSEIVRLYAEPYAGIYEQAPRSRVGAAAAGGAFNPGWAYGATKTVGAAF